MMDSRTASDLSPRQQQLAAATASAMFAERAAGAAQARRGEPAVGDRYVLPATADLPVEWVLLERHRELPAFLAALADTHPLVGGADFVLPAGALRLRGRATAWIEESALAPSLRVGALDPVTVERARRKLLKGPAEPDPESLGEVDASLEYRDWRREVIAPALAALGPQERFAVTPTPAMPATAQGGRPRRWAAAAAVFLASTLGLAGYAGWQQERLGDLAAAHREARQELETARAGERARQGQAASRAGQELRRLEDLRLAEAAKRQDLERRLADLQKRPAALPQALLNVPVAFLYPAERLRASNTDEDLEKVSLGAGAAPLTVVLNLDAITEYSSYRAVLTRPGSAAPLWQDDQLQLQEHRITFSLERRLVPPGDYRFDLFGLRGGQAEPLGEYPVKVLAR